MAYALSTIKDFDQAINTALQILGECLDADRVNLIETVDPPSDSAFPRWQTLEYEWNSPGVVPQYRNPEAAQGSYEEIPALYERLHQGQAISYLIETAPEPFRKTQIAIGVKSTHVIPIFVEGQWWGVLGLDDCREAKQHSDTVLAMLKIVADCIGSAIQRDRTQQTLLQAEQARVAELAKTNEELQQREREVQQSYRLLSTVARVTRDLLEAEDVEIAVPAALQAVGEVANMSRVQLLIEYQDALTQKLHHTVAYEWVAEGIVPQMNHPDAGTFNNDDFEFMLQDLYAGRSIWHIVKNFPSPVQARFEALGIKSCGTVPILIEGRYIGGVGFDDCATPRQWSQQEIDVLTTAAESIGAALHRKQLVDRLVEERIKAAQDRAIELAKATTALQNTVAALTTRRDLGGFLGEVLHTIAQEFDSPLVEYWAVLGSNSAEVDTWVYNNEMFTLRQGHEHPSRGGIRFLEDYVKTEDFTHRQRMFVFETPMPAYSLALDQIICPKEWYIARGVSRHFNFPLQAGETTVGSISVWLPSDRQISDESLRLGQALSHQTALAIQLTKLAEEAQQVAIAREQEKAAQERAAELAKANDALRRSARNIAQNSNIQDILPLFLREAIAVSGASAGAILRRVGDSEFEFVAILQGDDLIRGERLKTHPFYAAVKQISREDPTGWFTRLATGETLWRLTEDDQAGSLPECRDYHRPHQQRSVWDIPYKIGDRVAGYLGLAFQTEEGPSQVVTETVTALATQVGLALELTQLAEEAKQVAVAKLNEVIAREQEHAAQARVTDLAKANDALKHSLDRLAQDCNLNTFLGHVLNEITTQVQAAVGHIFLLNTDTKTLKLCLEIGDGQLYWQARSDEPALFHSAFPADITPVFQYLCEKRTLASLTAGELSGMAWPGTSEWFEREGFSEAVCLALIVGDQPVGLLGLAFHNKSVLKPEEAELIHALAHQVTLAIQMTHLADQAKQTAVLEERNRMAREIHDTIAQGLTGILIQLQAAEDVDLKDAGDRQAHVAQARHLAQASLAEARRSVQALRPQVLEDTNLAGALTRLMQNLITNTDVQVTCSIQGTLYALPPEVETNLLRIAQEAAHNTLKHAQASQIQMELSYQPNQVRLQMQDNGRGFDCNKCNEQGREGYGLISMQERSQQIGGSLTTASEIGKGTTVTIVVPLM
ncbi:GAF domain-containing protein [Oscillatoria sp. FACHB-1407]|uniref:GAF domain-containing protein n=1 Tax=Oscillatoria sp. FACHB-1407 TaxID=2692847 RepID=UPI0016885084|nr:GAF domain-containing protein [Oscillatoria sp. FACHB-1407]MBD2463580.1 GAF domain-containing protein [Oscillatoria sp. FACHB-1407]